MDRQNQRLIPIALIDPARKGMLLPQEQLRSVIASLSRSIGEEE